MPHEKFQSCIDACYACATDCDHCAVSCLGEQDVKAMARCIKLDMDCAQLCRLAASYMARGREFAQALCRLCADVCQACGDECATLQMDHRYEEHTSELQSIMRISYAFSSLQQQNNTILLLPPPPH